MSDSEEILCKPTKIDSDPKHTRALCPDWVIWMALGLLIFTPFACLSFAINSIVPAILGVFALGGLILVFWPLMTQVTI